MTILPGMDDVVTLVVDIDAATMSSGGQQWHVPRPADLLTHLAENFAGRWVHLASPDIAPDTAGVAQALAQARARNAAAVIARVVDPQGRQSPFLQRLSGLTHQPCAAGTLIVQADTLGRYGGASLSSAWDDDWLRDLALSLWWSTTVTALDLVVARSSRAQAPPLRLPPQRATLFADPLLPVDRTILVYGRIGASTSLYFDALASARPGTLRYLEPGDLFSDLPALAAAGLVIIVRGFEFALANGAVDLLTEIGTPIVWFTDDDFMALGSEVAGLGHYDAAAIRAFAHRLSTIVATSAPLATTLSVFHDRVVILRPSLDAALSVRRPEEPRAGVAAVIGGPFRARSLRQDVTPAAAHAGLKLIVPSSISKPSPDAKVLPFADDFRQFVPVWQREAPALLLHPYGDTANIGNKSVATLLCAAYFGAVPVVGDEPAYAGLDETHGVFKATRDPDDWYRQMQRLADPALRLAACQLLLRWADETCNLAASLPTFNRLLALARPNGRFAAEARLSAALASRTLQRTQPRQPFLVAATNRLAASAGRRLRHWRRRG